MAESTPEFAAESALEATANLLAESAGLNSPAPSPGQESANPLAGLPALTKGLLRIEVPVAVTLASQRKSVQDIVELGPGSIIKFEKTCDEPLELCVGGQLIATGEVVKVGDKFGLRVRQIGESRR
jgi:flagellar motor switch protein FliN